MTVKDLIIRLCDFDLDSKVEVFDHDTGNYLDIREVRTVRKNNSRGWQVDFTILNE